MEFVWRTVRYLGVAAPDAQDVAHEVFIIVQRRLADYDPRYRIRSWIAGVTRRVVMHHHRRLTRAEKKIAAVEPTVDPVAAPDEQVLHREAAAFLRRFLDGLSPARREVFVLGELEGLSAPEIADIVDENVNTVYSRLRTTRKAFQASVDRLETIRRREGG